MKGQLLHAGSLRRKLGTGLAVVAGAALVACGGGDDSRPSGSLTLGITDAPIDGADHVFVQFSSVTLVRSDDDFIDDDGLGGNGFGGDDTRAFETIEFDEPRRIDLLAQRNGRRRLLLSDEPVSAGDFDAIRLGVDRGIGDNVIVIDGREFDLDIPSGAEPGLEVARRFTVFGGGALDLTIDFDLRKSVVESPLGSEVFQLRPNLRLVRTAEVGEITIRATSGFINDRCPFNNDVQAIYVFEGDGIVPDDVDTSLDSDIDPITTANLTLDNATGDFTGTAGFLRPGIHTVAFTCDPENDLPQLDEGNEDVAGDVLFQDVTTVEVRRRGAASLGLSL